MSTFFNMMVGNCDNHAKNHALLYDRGPLPRLAPLYDILPVRLDLSVSHRFSFNVGSADHFDSLTRADIDAFLATFGLTKMAAVRFLSATIGPLAAALDSAARDLTESGLKDFDDLIGREMRKLIDVLGIAERIRERDYFASATGGWLLSS